MRNPILREDLKDLNIARRHQLFGILVGLIHHKVLVEVDAEQDESVHESPGCCLPKSIAEHRRLVGQDGDQDGRGWDRTHSLGRNFMA